MLSEVVTCNFVRNPGGHAESNPRSSEEGVSFCHVLRRMYTCGDRDRLAPQRHGVLMQAMVATKLCQVFVTPTKPHTVDSQAK